MANENEQTEPTNARPADNGAAGEYERAAQELVRRVRVLAASQPDVLAFEDPWQLFQRDQRIVAGLDLTLAQAQAALAQARTLGPLHVAPPPQVVGQPPAPAPAPVTPAATSDADARQALIGRAELLARNARRASSTANPDQAFVEALKVVGAADPVVAREAIKLAMREAWRSPAVDHAIDSLAGDQAKVGLALLAAFWNVGYAIGKQDAAKAVK